MNELRHLAIIMDGNRRWAKNKGLPSFAGHREGVNSLKIILKQCPIWQIKYLTVYVFSTENWRREDEEVKFLFDLLKKVLETELQELIDQGVCLRFIGDLQQLSPSLLFQIESAQKATAENNKVFLQIALNYGGRAEIVQAVQNIIKAQIPAEEITEENFANYLLTKGQPEPDLLIRTGGESRISNYLLWQIAYSEIIISPVLWPEFREKELKECLEEFQSRSRRFGK